MCDARDVRDCGLHSTYKAQICCGRAGLGLWAVRYPLPGCGDGIGSN